MYLCYSTFIYFYLIFIRTLCNSVEWKNFFLYKIFINKIKNRHLLLYSFALIVMYNWICTWVFFYYNLIWAYFFFLHLGPSLKFVSYCSADLTNVLIFPLLARTRWVHKSPASPRVHVCTRRWIYESGLQINCRKTYGLNIYNVDNVTFGNERWIPNCLNVHTRKSY